jgi:hypothetical protein
MEGMCESQSNVGRSFRQPYGASEFVLNQDVLTVLEVAWVNYQRLREHVSFADTSDDGENARVGVVLVENQERSPNGIRLLPAAAP